MEALILLGLMGVAIAVSKTRSDRAGTPGITGDWAKRWEVAGAELDLSTRVGNTSTMRGKIDGHYVTVESYRGTAPTIDVRFFSGLSSLDIEPRRKRTSIEPEAILDDADFEARFRVRQGESDEERKRVQEWLTPERREILTVLDDALDIDEVEEDDLEVRMPRNEWRASELAQAVRLCVLVAQTLDEAFQPMPQDAVQPSPQDAELPRVETPPQDAIRQPPEPA